MRFLGQTAPRRGFDRALEQQKASEFPKRNGDNGDDNNVEDHLRAEIFDEIRHRDKAKREEEHIQKIFIREDNLVSAAGLHNVDDVRVDASV